MEAAFALLGWTPETFWRATPKEFAAAYDGVLALKGLSRKRPLTRGEFETLKRRFPDRREAR